MREVIAIQEVQNKRFKIYRPENDVAVLLDVRQFVPDGRTWQMVASLVDEGDLLGAFVKEARAYPVLPEESQLALGRLVYHGRAAGEVLKENPYLPSLKQRELQDLCEWGNESKERLFKHNLGLIFKVAGKNLGWAGTLTFSDLINEGAIGFIEHTDRFDPYQGFAFSTYITRWIEQSISRAIADTGRLIRLPVHRSDEILRLYKNISQLRQKLGREPRLEEIAKFSKQPADYIGDLIQLTNKPSSLEAPVGDEEESELGDFVMDPSPQADIASYVDKKLLKEAVQTFLNTLPERERMIFMLRFGLRDGRPLTLEETANYCGVTRERVRQLIVRTLEELTPEQKKILLPFHESSAPRRRKHGER